MSTGAILLASALKILFIVLVVIGAFAPLLVWVDRRQSAMIQDRVGPHRAGFTLPKDVVKGMASLLVPLNLGRYGAVGVAVLCFALLFAMGLGGLESLGEVTPKDLYKFALAMFVFSFLLHLGWKVHSGIVNAGGKITLFGVLHPAADAMKMIWKEDFVPERADKLLHALAPVITLIPALASFAVIPFADVLYLEYWDQVLPVAAEGAAEAVALAGDAVPMQVASLNVGILFIFAVAGTGVIGAAIGGYASDNKFSLMGGMRAASQMVSYEVALGLTIVPCFMIYDSLRLEEMALWQAQNAWGIFLPPLTLAFILYFTAATAETKRVPFDVPEGESELVGGYLTEYSGLKFGIFFTGEYVEMVAFSALAAVLFFGGWDVPWLYANGFDLPGTWAITVPLTDWVISDKIAVTHWVVIALQVVSTLVKVIAFLFLQMMIRWSLPRFRYDQIMSLCWKGLLPLALVNILLTGILILLFD
ncbi:MAG: complex I subunit 1 family protein [Myxococcota bacterium]